MTTAPQALPLQRSASLVIPEARLRKKDTFKNSVSVLLSIACMAFLGVELRQLLVLNSFLPQDDSRLSFLLPAETIPNFFGCMIMGFFSSWGPWSSILPEQIHKSITVGFCGSVTTFSSVVVKMIATTGGGEWRDFPVVLVGIVTNLWISYSAHLIGLQLSDSIFPYFSVIKESTPDVPVGTSTGWLWILISIFCGAYVPVITISLIHADTNTNVANYCAPLMFAPLGAVIRFMISILNWKTIGRLQLPIGTTYICQPWGTEISNLLSCAIAGGIEAFILQDSKKSARSVWLASSLMAGFCGSLSTTSSFIRESHDGWKPSDVVVKALNQEINESGSVHLKPSEVDAKLIITSSNSSVRNEEDGDRTKNNKHEEKEDSASKIGPAEQLASGNPPLSALEQVKVGEADGEVSVNDTSALPVSIQSAVRIDNIQNLVELANLYLSFFITVFGGLFLAWGILLWFRNSVFE